MLYCKLALKYNITTNLPKTDSKTLFSWTPKGSIESNEGQHPTHILNGLWWFAKQISLVKIKSMKYLYAKILAQLLFFFQLWCHILMPSCIILTLKICSLQRITESSHFFKIVPINRELLYHCEVDHVLYLHTAEKCFVFECCATIKNEVFTYSAFKTLVKHWTIIEWRFN